MAIVMRKCEHCGYEQYVDQALNRFRCQTCGSENHVSVLHPTISVSTTAEVEEEHEDFFREHNIVGGCLIKLVTLIAAFVCFMIFYSIDGLLCLFVGIPLSFVIIILGWMFSAVRTI